MWNVIIADDVNRRSAEGDPVAINYFILFALSHSNQKRNALVHRRLNLVSRHATSVPDATKFAKRNAPDTLHEKRRIGHFARGSLNFYTGAPAVFAWNVALFLEPSLFKISSAVPGI
jgi:hypothetical protein